MLCGCAFYSELSANASCSGTRAQPAGLPGICCSLGIATCFPLSGLIHSNMCPPSSYPQTGSSACIPHAPLWHLVSSRPPLHSPLFLLCISSLPSLLAVHLLAPLPAVTSSGSSVPFGAPLCFLGCRWVTLLCHFNMD